MKKNTLFSLLAFFCLTGGSAWAQTFTQGDLKFTVTDAAAKTVSVAKANNIEGDLVIPSTVTYGGVDYTVTTIVGYGFSSTAITSLTIPASVDSIGKRAFGECGSLASIRIEDSAKPLKLWRGNQGTFNYSNGDKTFYIGRDLKLDADGNLFYNGTGNVTSVEFGNLVTYINNFLFKDSDKLNSLTIGSGVKTIGAEAFMSSGDDTESVGELVVTMGENVETIGTSAFNSCSQLYSISLPTTLKNIDGWAFSKTGLTSLTIPAAVDSIGKRAFGECGSLASIRIEDSAKPLKLWRGNEGTFNYSNADKTFYIGRDLKLDYNDRLFNNVTGNVTSLEFGDHVTAITPYLFKESDKLNSLTIGSGVKTIGAEAFMSSGDDTESVGELVVTMGENVETIGTSAFNSCSQLYSISLPTTLKNIDGWAFSATGLRDITIPASVDSIGKRAFGSCGNLASIRIEDSAEPLKLWRGNEGTFNYSNADKTFYIGRDLKLDYNDRLFNNGTGNVTSLEFGDQVTTITPYLFKESDKLSSLTIGGGVKTIGTYAFYGSGDDTESVAEMVVTMGENVETIKANAFDLCSQLYSISLPATLKTIDGYAFSATGLRDITIPASVDSIGKRAFGSCGNLASIRIEDSAEPLKLWRGNEGTFNYSNADKTFYIGRDLKLDADGTLFNNGIGNVTSLEFGDQVTTINPYLFKESDKLNSLTIGSGVKTIGAEAFYGSGDDDEIGEMVVTMGENVETIGANAFDLCKKMTSITLPATLTTIGNTAFASTGLTSISIPGSVTSIGQQAFGWNPLTIIRFEDGEETCTLVNGYNGVFRNPGADYTLYLGRNIEYQGNSSPFPNVTAVEIGPKVTDLPAYLFYDRDKLISVTGGENVATMGARVYWECNNLESISPLGKNLKVLPESTFEMCEKLNGIVLPDGLEEIQQWAFHRCRALTELTIPGSVKVMGTKPDGGNGYRVFYENAAMKKLVFADSDTPLKYIETNSSGGYCRGMTALETLYIGRDIVKGEGSVGGNMFVSGDNIEFGPTVTEIGTNFSEITATSVKAPWQTPIAIADNAFNAATYSNATLWLPGGTRQAYAEADGWKKFVNVDFASFFVTGTATAGGTLKFAGETVTNGTKSLLIDRESNVLFEVAPEENYDFTSLTINGEEVPAQENGNTYTWYLLQDIDVVATFTEKPKFDIKATATGGTVSLNGANFSASQNIKAYRDTDVTLAIAANEGYENPKVTVNGQDVTAQLQNNTLKLENIQEAKTIVVTYSKMKFQIAKQTTQNGTITLSKTVVEWGDSFTATFTPATGYELATATLNNQDVTAQVANNVLTVTDVKENKTVGATFKKVVFNVTVSGGGITVSNMNPQYGDNVTVTIDDDPDLTLVTLLVNGQDVTAQVVNGQYIIRNVTGDVTIEATFKSTKEFITMTGDYATFSCPQDLNFTGSDLRAYIASGFNKNTNQVLLVRVYDVPAATGVFLVGEPGTTYKVPYAETGSYYVNLFQANLQRSTISATTGNYSNYIFGEQDGDPGFYPIEGRATLLAQTAYLQLPSSFVAAGVKVSLVFEDDIIDGMSDMSDWSDLSDESVQIYDLAGRRLGKTQRGINIVNGKKILVK